MCTGSGLSVVAVMVFLLVAAFRVSLTVSGPGVISSPSRNLEECSLDDVRERVGRRDVLEFLAEETLVADDKDFS